MKMIQRKHTTQYGVHRWKILLRKIIRYASLREFQNSMKIH